jgi:hypothetical protein
LWFVTGDNVKATAKEIGDQRQQRKGLHVSA